MMRVISWVSGLCVLLCTESLVRAGDCKQAAQQAKTNKNVKYAQVLYWDGKTRDCITGCDATLKPADKVIVFFQAENADVTNEMLGLTRSYQPDAEAPEPKKAVTGVKNCLSRRLVFGDAKENPASSLSPEVKGEVPELSLKPGDVIEKYLHPMNPQKVFGATSATSIASEAVQILGQIVVDRASQEGYALVRTKLMSGLKCKDEKDDTKDNPGTHFQATCHVIDQLRLQDLAMAPSELRAALVEDALAFVHDKPATASAIRTGVARVDWSALSSPAGTALVVTPASQPAPTISAATAPVAESVGTTPLVADPFEFLRVGVERRIVPLLNRPIVSLTGHSAELEIRSLVDSTLRTLEKRGADAYCQLQAQDRVLATAALAFAACAGQTQNKTCSVMQVAQAIDGQCVAGKGGDDKDKPGERLTDPQLSYAESIAGHLHDAYTLEKDQSADVQGRLVAAADASFEVACMYAARNEGEDGKTAGYECKIDEAKHGTLGAREKVALLRDIVLAALARDGTGLVAVVIRAAVRVLPDPAKSGESRAIRTLASVAAYAATYTSGTSPADTHKQRTALLESLTKDMTYRTDRGGDVIFGLGGSLRAVGGARVGRSTAGTAPTAVASPVSLTLGLGLDWLFDGSTRGLHLEAGVLDLGQYLSWDEGWKVSAPDLGAALSPSLTVGYFWHRELPVVVGATLGYTPSYTFTSDGSKPQGALTIGAIFGIYVPLFDFN